MICQSYSVVGFRSLTAVYRAFDGFLDLFRFFAADGRPEAGIGWRFAALHALFA